MYAFDKPMTLDMNALLELISSLSIDKNDARWKTSQSFYTSVKTSFDMEFGESENSANPIEMLAQLTGDSENRKIYEDVKRKLSKEMPFINGKIVDFVPVVQEMNVWTNGELDDTAGNQLNYYIDNIKRKLDEPAIKMITGFFNNGVPMVPFPQV